MELRTCGNSDLKLSLLGLGCWSFGGGDYWGERKQSDVNKVVSKAIDLGINYFDTAEAYNDGRSESSLGEAVSCLQRNKLIIGTKISPSNAYPETLIQHCENSLERLRTDYIDLYMIHWPLTPNSIRHFTNNEALISNPPKVDSAFEGLEKLRKQGKIRYIGISNFGAVRMDEVLKTSSKVVANELPYSLLGRAIEWDILPHCVEKKVGVIGYMPLLQGLLADIYPTLDDVPVWQRRTRHFNCKRADKLCRHGENGAEAETIQAIDSIRLLAQENNLTVPSLSLKWAVSGKGISCILAGSNNVTELNQNVEAVVSSLPQELKLKLDNISEKLKIKLGKSFDYYENEKNDRTK